MRVTDALRSSGLTSADAEILLAHACGRDRTWVVAHPEFSVDPATMERWEAMRERRRKSEPVAYILGEKEFFGRTFTVDRRVLIPRPATEGLVEAAMAYLDHPRNAITPIDAGIVACAYVLRRQTPNAIVDVGTGSGCIAITLSLERPDCTVYASDVSEEALALARYNATTLNAPVRFAAGTLLDPFGNLATPFLLVSNPPYIPDGTALSPDVADFEPASALFAGADGLDVLLPLARAARRHPQCVGMIVECEERQIPAFLAALQEGID